MKISASQGYTKIIGPSNLKDRIGINWDGKGCE